MPSVTLCAQSPFVFPVSRSRIIAAQRAYIVTRVHTCWYCKLYPAHTTGRGPRSPALVSRVARASVLRRPRRTVCVSTSSVDRRTIDNILDRRHCVISHHLTDRVRVLSETACDTVSCAACGSDLSVGPCSDRDPYIHQSRGKPRTPGARTRNRAHRRNRAEA